jgi:DNA-binding LytR/AlgR family response regulator
MRINIAICDDCSKDAVLLENSLFQIIKDKGGLDLEIEVYNDPLNFIGSYKAGDYSILFLDIEMPEENGIQLAKKLRVLDRDILIIYLTSYEVYMKESFEVQPFRYMLKPVNYTELYKVFYQAMDAILENNDYIIFTSNQITYQVPTRSIFYATVDKGRKIRLVSEVESYEYYGKLGELEEKWAHTSFVRIHTGYLVNMKYIKKLTSLNVVLMNDECLPVSRPRRNIVKSQFHQFIEKKVR